MSALAITVAALSGGLVMMRWFVGISSALLTVAFLNSASAEASEEGTASGTASYSGASKALAMGKERLHIVYEMHGVLAQDSEGNFPASSASTRCVGSFHAIKGAFNNNSGFCVYMDAEGDQWFSTYDSAGQIGQGKGTYTIVGGTGKYQGISGGGEFTYTDMRPVSEGTFQTQTKYKGNWKLPSHVRRPP